MACPGSVAAEKAAPSKGTSESADAGTRAHAAFARHLVAGTQADDPALALAIDLARRFIAGRPFMVELRLPPLPGSPDIWGTSDLVVFSTAGPLETILDLKFGEAIGVEPDEPQPGIYTLLGARRFGASEVGIDTWIVQPRLDHAAGPARRHRYSHADLDRIEAEIRAAAAATKQLDAPRQAGPWCRFCGAAGECPTRKAAPSAVPAARSAFFRPRPRWMTKP
jgi:hypothetical protein